MQTFDLFAEPEWDAENDRSGYRHRRVAIAPQIGGKAIGTTLYELDPGEATWPYHYELGCEEWLLVVTGRPTLRTPDGERELRAGDVVVFPEGPEGAHAVVNRTEERLRVAFVSSKSPLAVVHYPDSGKVGIWTQARGYEAMLGTEPQLDYWEGE